MGAGKYEQVSDAGDMQWLDPTGNYAAQQANLGQLGTQYGAQLQGSLDPEAYMNQFLGQQAGLANLVSGQNSQLQQGLNAIASRQAQLGGEAALASMPGMRNSGAAMAAFGQAYADPFAQAQSQLQQNQLQGTLGLWNQALGLNAQQQAQRQSTLGNLYGNILGLQTGMAQDQSAWYTPQYEYQKGGWDYTMDAINTGANVASAVAGFTGPKK